MAYIVLVLAIVLGTSGSVIMKFFQRGRNLLPIYTVLQFATFASLVAAVMFFCINGFKLSFNKNSLYIALGMSLQITLNTPTQIKAYEKGNVAIAVVSSMLGSLLVPFLYGIIFLNEGFTLFKGIGLSLILATTVLMLPSKNQLKNNKGGIIYYLLCFMIFIFNGIFFTLMKVHSYVGDMSESGLMCYTYGFMAIFSAITLLIIYVRKRKTEEKSELKSQSIFSQGKLKNILFFIGYGCANSLGNMCSLYSSQFLPASVQFPLVSGGVIISSAVTSLLFFKEKITLKGGIMLLCAVASIIFFAI